jgi:hypothetical protein
MTMDYTQADHARRYHMGAHVRDAMGFTTIVPMRGFLMEGPYMEEGSWYRVDHRAHVQHWSID